jgi:hypothetical protein
MLNEIFGIKIVNLHLLSLICRYISERLRGETILYKAAYRVKSSQTDDQEKKNHQHAESSQLFETNCGIEPGNWFPLTSNTSMQDTCSEGWTEPVSLLELKLKNLRFPHCSKPRGIAAEIKFSPKFIISRLWQEVQLRGNCPSNVALGARSTLSFGNAASGMPPWK